MYEGCMHGSCIWSAVLAALAVGAALPSCWEANGSDTGADTDSCGMERLVGGAGAAAAAAADVATLSASAVAASRAESAAAACLAAVAFVLNLASRYSKDSCAWDSCTHNTVDKQVRDGSVTLLSY